MASIKERVLREFGDEGADTFGRYWAQVEYTAFWCIRMLRENERIEAVIPEGIEDVVIVRDGMHELHQVKTRDESQGPWTTADVLPVLCQQYHRGRAFDGHCEYHFVSNQVADERTQLRQGSYGPLYRLKFLLEIKHDGQPYRDDEREDMERFQEVLLPRILDRMATEHGDQIDAQTGLLLLHNTWIDTNYSVLQSPNNLVELDAALLALFPGTPRCRIDQLERMYVTLLVLVARRIKECTTIEDRRMTTQDVLGCRVASSAPEIGFPDLDQLPGSTPMDKKALLGGFDPTEIPMFHRQAKLAAADMRELANLGLQDRLERLRVALLDEQAHCRNRICREQGIQRAPGPEIRSLLRLGLASLARTHFPHSPFVDEQFCLGVLWEETDLCYAWWHAPGACTQEAAV